MPSLHQSTAPRHARKRLVMIMGVQRSGTTALFEALATAPGVTARNESPDDEIYRDYFLRPEPQIRHTLAGLPGTVLLKPVRESELRRPQAVVEEYGDYDLRIVWLYRDPVNVFDSHVRRGWTTADPVSAGAFAGSWLSRNAAAIADASMLGDRLLVVRYEDLVVDPRSLPQLAEKLGVIVRIGFGTDSALGRQRQPEPVRLMIDGYTDNVRSRLDLLRAVRPACDSVAQTNAAPAEARRSMTSTAEYRQVSHARDPASLHSPWLAAGPLRRDASTDTFVSLGYAASSAILGCSRPLQAGPSISLRTDRDSDETDLKRFFAVRRNTMAERVGASVNRFLASLPVGETCNLFTRLTSFSAACMAIWLDVPESTAAALSVESRRLYVTADSDEPSPAWLRLHEAILARGLVAELCGSGLLDRNDVLGFICDTAIRFLAVPSLVCNVMVAFANSPRILSLSHECPAMIPGIFAEATRLVPTWFSLKRQMTKSLHLSGLVVPKDATVDVFVATANRDPAAFEAPDDLRPDRRGPRPILIDIDAAPYTGLTNNPPWGCSHVLFDVAALVLERLLAGPLTMAFDMPPRSAILPMPNGDLLQIPRELLVRFQPRSA